MRWSSLLALILSLFFIAGTLAAPVRGLGQRDVEATSLEARQETDPKSGPTTTEDTSSEASVTATRKEEPKTATDVSAAAEATDTGIIASSTASATTTDATTTATNTHTAASATSTVPSLDGETASSQRDAADSTRPTYSGGLPIEPKITPAWGVGGFILMASGAVLAFIGVRKQWVQIFLATGFLSALGVTVLIIYVMSPPVSNAVQGGYLVAVFFTGAVFGGLSLVFREICEGLGCLLGGFCLSMWFLALKSGGLLTEGGPKAGMIIAFTVGFYSLSFSHYTRPYGLIGCTSFSGATALVLGIDCYSKAGLKEFWLYIWGLNNNVLPLRTDTYPVTRGIRVELAATIIVGVLGVISQVRLWSVIKERRATEENSRREHDRKIEEEDIEAGRRLEEKNIQERAEWELIYGNGKAVSVSETAVGESRRGSDGFESSDNEKEGAVEIKDMPSPDTSGSSSDGEKNDQGENEPRGLETVPEEQSSQREGESAQEQENQQEGQSEDKTPRPTTPVITPVLGEGKDDSSEVGADIGSEVGTPRSKRLSGTETLNRLSWRNSNGVMVSSDTQGAPIAHDDASSSVVGVMDDLHEMSDGCPSVVSDADVRDRDNATQQTTTTEPAPVTGSADVETKPNDVLTDVQHSGASLDTTTAKQDVEKVITDERPTTQTVRKVSSVRSAILALEQAGNSKITEPSKRSVSATSSQTEVADAVKQAEAAAKVGTPTSGPSPMTGGEAKKSKEASSDSHPTAEEPITHPKVEAMSEPKAEPKIEPKIEPKTEPKVEPPHEPKSEPKIELKVEPKIKVLKRLDASTVKFIPEQTSRVVHSYRTNEWAKHLADADTPEMEPIEFDPEPEAEISDETHETAAVVDVDGLLQTPLTAQPPPIVNRPEGYETEIPQPAFVSSVPSPELPLPKTRTTPQGLAKVKPTPVSRNDSTCSANVLRSSPGPLSPVQEPGLATARNASTPLLTITTPNEAKETEPSPRWNGPPPLLAVRENMVRNRMSSTSNRYDPWASRNISRQSLPEISPPIPPISPPLSVPEEKDEAYAHPKPKDEDDIPLSKRRTLLQRQIMKSPSLHSLDAARSPVYPSPAPAGELNRSASRMAAWRQSVREEITHKWDPLTLQSPPYSPASPDRPRNPWSSVQQMREASSNQLGNAIAEGMQRGSMTDLHRQAMRRMQASANRQL